MKKLVFVFAFLTLISSQIFAQWTLVNVPSWYAYDLNDVYFADENTGYIVGDNGIIFKTTNGGIIWDYIPSNANNNLRSLYFLNPDTGFVCGSEGTTLKTTNGGGSWSGGSGQGNYYSIYFSDANNGVMVGSIVVLGSEWPLIYRTTNAGAYWQAISVSGLSFPNSVFFVNSSTGFILGLYNQLSKTTNGGNSWFTSTPPGISKALDLFFTSVDTGYIVGGSDLSGDYPTIRKTTDGGISWNTSLILPNYTNSFLTKIFFVNKNIGYAVGKPDFILKTTDGGINWIIQQLDSIPNLFLSSVFFTNENSGYAVGDDGVILQTISGAFLPVELTTFSASTIENNVNLFWSTATETNNQGFQIERSLDKTSWATIGFREGRGTSSEPQNYSFSDDISEISSQKFYYRLKQIDFNGSFEYSDIVEVEITPSVFSLSQNYPNPFNPSTIIRFSIPSVETHRDASLLITLKVFDVLGKEIATLVNEEKSAGSYEIEFNAGASRRLALTSGVYYYQLRAGDYVETKKMVLLK